MTEGRTIRVLGFAGSLRKGSVNRALIRAAQGLAPPNLSIEIFDIAAVPLYNGDVEAAGEPEAVTTFKQAIRAADALLIATPEYNHGVPGVMKNAIDWASRPAGKSPMSTKPVGIVGASPGMTGSARGQIQLRQALESINCYCMPQPELLVGQAYGKFDEQGNLTDEKTREVLGKYLMALAAWAGRFVS
jgi:chromate reductase, NAD(P)H dehydrogenase (quinone)